MSDRTVLWVGREETAFQFGEGVQISHVATVEQAIDYVGLSPPTLVVVGSETAADEGLDLVRHLMGLRAEADIPIAFLGDANGGRQSFVYESRRSGFTVRFVDAGGSVQRYFVGEEGGKRRYAVRPLNAEQFAEEIRCIIAGEGDAQGGVRELGGGDIWEIGFNDSVVVEGTTYSIQTEVVSVDPVVAATTVFVEGRALHTQDARVSSGQGTWVSTHALIQGIHLDVIRKLEKGKLQ